MYWKLTCLAETEAPAEGPVEGRFVVHRHHDAAGPHLDVRLEQDGYLAGWRVDGVSFENAPWATEKMPHPVEWLLQDGEAVREDEGVYAWRERTPEGGTIELRGRAGVRRLRVERMRGLSARCVRAIAEALGEEDLEEAAAAQLIRDGQAARQRSIARFCGLGRELDGAAFDEALWRKTLTGLTLREIASYLEGLEVRFDRAYPPQPVSQPEPLPAWSAAEDAGRAFEILLG
jgi:hypothetical protein